jgi:hypothetical protein
MTTILGISTVVLLVLFVLMMSAPVKPERADYYPKHDPSKGERCGCRPCMSAFFAEARLRAAAERDRVKP